MQPSTNVVCHRHLFSPHHLQRMFVRQQGGKCTVWGKPAEVIRVRTPRVCARLCVCGVATVVLRSRVVSLMSVRMDDNRRLHYSRSTIKQPHRLTSSACAARGSSSPCSIHPQATYTTEGDKTVKTSILLVSGYWGLARHFHYVPEILAAVFWTIPAGFNHALPWFYVVFLTFLLFDRAYRDDARCRAKYGVFWDKYCKKVPYKVIPGII